MRAGAFTLVELLVVVVIILALIAVAMPVSNLVRARSLVSGCGSNLGQIGKAVIMYADDHQGWLPCHSLQSVKELGERAKVLSTPVVGRPKDWRDSLSTYTRSHEVFWCPADSHRGTEFIAEYDHPEDHRQQYTSYQMSHLLLYLRKYRGPNGTLVIRVSKLRTGPSETYYIGDWVALPADSDFGLTAHGRGGNGLLLDGSVKWHPELVTKSGRN